MKSKLPDLGQGGKFLARGSMSYALVVSHSCQIDKPKHGETVPRNQALVVVAPILPLDGLGENDAKTVLDEKNFGNAPLKNIPSLGSYFVNLRRMTSVGPQQLEASKRIASMTESGRNWLRTRLIAFFFDRDLPKVKGT